MSFNRRTVLKGALAAGVATSALKVPAAVAQPGPIKVGFLTVKSGALASGGLQMEQGITTFLKQRNNMIAGRPVEMTTGDTAGNPAQARTKTQELVERFGVHVLIGPLAAFEALAIDDYIRSSKTPILTVAGAEDMTQRKANPWLVRPSCTSAQCSYPMADYAAKELKLKRAITIADDFAYGHENVAGFQKVFEDAGGKVIQKIFTPLNAPDYGTYLSQFKDADCLYTGHAGSNGLKLIRQLAEYGLKGKFTIVGGFTPIDEFVAAADGRGRCRLLLGLLVFGRARQSDQQEVRRRHPARLQDRSGRLRGRDLRGGRGAGDRAQVDRRQGRGQGCAQQGAARGQPAGIAARAVALRQLRQLVGPLYIRKVEKKDGKYVNTVMKTYPNVSQFWTYKPEEFLKEPVFSRDYPPAKNLE